MPVSDAYQAYIRDLLAAFEPLRIRRMFGGAGVYARDLFVAILVDDEIYLKTDDANRPDFERLGLQPFSYRRTNGRTATMSFYPPPAAALDGPEALRPWVESALAAARRAAGA